MRTDTERLDWLEKNQTSLFRVIWVRRVPTTTPDNRYEEVVDFLGWSTENRSDECASVREAIDAAMDNVPGDIFHDEEDDN